MNNSDLIGMCIIKKKYLKKIFLVNVINQLVMISKEGCNLNV